MRFRGELVTFSSLVRLCGVALVICFSDPGSAALAAESGWKVLFDGSNVSAWRTLNRAAGSPVAWMIEGDALAWRKGCGHITSREDFGDFELELEWKISPAGNSGVMFRVDDSSDKPWQSGPEIQLLDNAKHPDARHAARSSGAIYGLYAPPVTADLPVGEWNQLKVRVVGSKLRVQLNGRQTFDLDMKSDEWTSRVAKSKFAPFPQFGRGSSGKLVLQDHGNPVWFRNIRVRPVTGFQD